ncbi:hypothetical protein L7F22_018678 [Adiantum nelumboides]|nr:hypothetical protein [Adiantum nelumboides]
MIWYFDSGASRHITSRKDLFSSLDAAPAGKKVTCANNASYPIKGVGKILITISDGSDLCLPDVLYVPGIKKNLLSVSSLAKNGLRVIFEDDRCIVRDRENGYSLVTTGTLENGLFVLDRYEKQIQACIAETKTQAMQDAELWHARFGHVGYGSLMTLQRHNMVHDLSLLEMPPRHVCEGCVLGKMHRFAFSQDGSVRATRKLQLVHSDVCGPMRTPSVGNSLYFVTFIDDFSRFCWVYPLKAKSDVFAVFQHYVSMVENETGCKVQTLRTDRGGEYMSGAFKDFLGKKGIKHQCTMPYTPQQNGVVERKNRSLMEMARCMLKAKSLPHKLWMEAVACAAHVLNRCPTRALKTITPYESWYDRKPSVNYLRVFGCLAYAHIPQQLRGKLDDKAVKCIFVGYSSGSKGYRLYNPATNKIFESRDVIFTETTAQPMVAFDVTHMQTQDVFEGFLPSFVENQESQQVDNFDQSFDQHVTPHDVEEIVREEQEVLREERTLPKWVQKTLQDSKLDAPLPRKTQYAYNNTIHTSTGKTPFEVIEGRLRLPLILKPHEKIFAADEEVRDIRVAFDKIKESIQSAQQTYKRAADKHRKPLQFKEGDWVLLRFTKARLNMTTGKNWKGEQTGHQKYYMKLAKRYYGPFQMLSRINETVYRLKLPANWHIHNAFHVSLLKPFKGDPPKDPVQEEPPLFDDIEEVLQPEEILRHEENTLRSGISDEGRLAIVASL